MRSVKNVFIILCFLLLTGRGLYPYFSYTRVDLGLDCVYWDHDPRPGERRLFPALIIGINNSAGPVSLGLNIGLGRQEFSLLPDQAVSDNDINLTYDAFIPYNWLDSYRMGHKIDLVIDFFRFDFQYRSDVRNAFISDNKSKSYYKGSLFYFVAREQVLKPVSLSQTYGLWYTKELATVNGSFGDNRYRFGAEGPVVETNTDNSLLSFSVQGIDFPFRSLSFDVMYVRSDRNFKPDYDIVVFQQELVWDFEGVDSMFTYYLPYKIRVFTGPGYYQKVSDSNWQKYLVHAGAGCSIFTPVDITFAYLYQRMDINGFPFNVHMTWTDLIVKFSGKLDSLLKYRTSLSQEGGIDSLASQVSFSLAYHPVRFAAVNLTFNRTIPRAYFQKAVWPPDNGVMLEAVFKTTILDTAKR